MITIFGIILQVPCQFSGPQIQSAQTTSRGHKGQHILTSSGDLAHVNYAAVFIEVKLPIEDIF